MALLSPIGLDTPSLRLIESNATLHSEKFNIDRDIPLPKPMISKRSKLQEDTHFRVLRLLQQNPEMSQRELAQMVGVSVGGMHYVLRALIDKGLVKLANFSAAEDKRRYAYVLTRKGIARKAALTHAFLVRKMEEYDALREEIAVLKNDLKTDDLKKSP